MAGVITTSSKYVASSFLLSNLRLLPPLPLRHISQHQIQPSVDLQDGSSRSSDAEHSGPRKLELRSSNTQSKDNMPGKLKNVSGDVHDKASNSPIRTSTNGISKEAEAGANRALSSLDGLASRILTTCKSVIDGTFPPDKRAAFFARLQDFMSRNPRLSAFLGMNLALSGVPLGLFILFSLSVFIFALVVALIIGLLAAVLFTVFMVSIALFFVLPTVLFTTAAACFLFFWGLGGYYILKWASGNRQGEVFHASRQESVEQRLNDLTGGRLGELIEGVDSQTAKEDISAYNEQHTKPRRSKSDRRPSASEPAGDVTSKTAKMHDAVSNASTPTEEGLKGSTGSGG